jgi:hypothetical protein
LEELAQGTDRTRDHLRLPNDLHQAVRRAILEIWVVRREQQVGRN